jgi:hypothetical protein
MLIKMPCRWRAAGQQLKKLRRSAYLGITPTGALTGTNGIRLGPALQDGATAAAWLAVPVAVAGAGGMGPFSEANSAAGAGSCLIP